MNAVIAAAAELQAVCEAEGWRFCLIGGVRPGQPGPPAAGGQRRRPRSPWGGLPFEGRVIERSSRFRFPPAVHLRTCSAEDLIVLKVFADRPRDWLDVEGVLIRHAGRLDWAMIGAELAPLLELKEAPDLLDRLDQLRRQVEA